MVDAFLGKKYKLASSENFDEFMKALGVGFVLRKVGNTISPVAELKKEGDEYVLYSFSTFKNVVVRFKLGVEVEYESPDSRVVKSTFTIDDNTLHEVQKDSNGKEIIVDRTYVGDEIRIVSTVDDISATRIYKLQD